MLTVSSISNMTNWHESNLKVDRKSNNVNKSFKWAIKILIFKEINKKQIYQIFFNRIYHKLNIPNTSGALK